MTNLGVLGQSLDRSSASRHLDISWRRKGKSSAGVISISALPTYLNERWTDLPTILFLLIYSNNTYNIIHIGMGGVTKFRCRGSNQNKLPAFDEDFYLAFHCV